MNQISIQNLKLFGHVRPFCSAVHVHERSIHFSITKCDLHFTFLLKPHYGIMVKMMKYQFINIQTTSFSSNFLYQWIDIFIQIYFGLFPSILSISQASFNNPYLLLYHNHIQTIIHQSVHILISLLYYKVETDSNVYA